MANVKSRLKTPKSATKKGRDKTKKSSTGPKETELPIKDTECEVVIKRPSTQKVMTPDEKVQYILQNGHILKDQLIVRAPANVKPKPEYSQLSIHRDQKHNGLPLLSRSGRIKKNMKVNLSHIDNILKNELMIHDDKNKHNSNGVQTIPPSPVVTSNNNDNAITDRNNTPAAFSDVSTYNIASEVLRDSPDQLSEDSNYSDNSITNRAKQCNKESKYKKKSDEPTEDPLQIDLKTRKRINGSKQIKRDTKHRKNKTDEMCIDNSSSEELVENILKEHKKGQKLIKKGTASKTKNVGLSDETIFRAASFQCDHCQRKFNRKCSLRRHMYKHLGIQPFTCPHCLQNFRSHNTLQTHVERSHKITTQDADIFMCRYCDEMFLSKNNLKKHLSVHINMDIFKCIYCDEVFEHHLSLIKHETQHMVRGYYQCTLCSMSYRNRSRLYLHIKSHLKIKDYICQYCGKEFLRRNSLTRHVEVHHGGHRIVCPVCKKNLKGHLTEHMRTHQKKRPHKCPDCGQEFTQSTQLNVHRRSHTGARPYLCRICDLRFTHSNALMLHIRRHTGEKPFACAMCPMFFSQLPHMKAHMRNIHGKQNPYKCSKCDSFFKLKVELENHDTSCKSEKVKGKKKKSKEGEEEIQVESPMSLSRMRFLLALLLTMIATAEKLKYLGFNKRLIDDILIESVEAMNSTPCKDMTLSPLKRLRLNIELLLNGTVPKEEMEKFKKENMSTEDILELLTTDNESKFLASA